jgi:hypothetical protein
VERRILTTSTGLNFFLQQHLGWSSVRQVFRVTRECTETDRTTGERRTSREVSYGITDLSRSQANAPRLLDLHRGHWSIENGVFYVRDEAFGEDRSRIRKRAGPQVRALPKTGLIRVVELRRVFRRSVFLHGGPVRVHFPSAGFARVSGASS